MNERSPDDLETPLSRTPPTIADERRPSVSIVIPFWRGVPFLQKTVACLRNQTYPTERFEVIVASDGSTEDLLPVCAVARDMPLQIVRQERSGFRASSARNLGLSSASGEIILSIDFDMLCPPSFIDAHVSRLVTGDRVATIGIRRFVDSRVLSLENLEHSFTEVEELPDVPSISNNSSSLRDKRLSYIRGLEDLPFPANAFDGCNVGYRREDAVAIGGWDTDYDGGLNYEDIDFGHRLWLSGVRLVFAERAAAYHQENDFVSLEDKRRWSDRNRKLLYSRFPDLAAFREKAEQWTKF